MELKNKKVSEAGLIPSDWNCIELRKICTFFNGQAHEGIVSKNGDFKLVNSKFISTEGKVYKNVIESIQPLRQGDITIVMSDIPNGKALAKTYEIEVDGKYTLNQRIGGVRPKGCNGRYLYYILNRNKYFLAFDSGTGQTNLRKDEVLKCPVAIPESIDEQGRISTSLDNITLLIDELQKLIAKKKNIKQGLMQELLTGKRRLPEFVKNWDGKHKKTDVGEIPSDWEYLKVKDLINSSIIYPPMDGNHGDIHPKSSDYVKIGVPFVMANSIVDGQLVLKKCNRIKKSQADSLLKGFSLKGDILLTHKGTVGSVAEVRNIDTDYIMLTPQVTYYRVKDEGELDSVFLRFILMSDLFQTHLKLLSGGGTRAYIGIVAQHELPFLLCSLPEQKAIGKVLTNFEDEIQELQRKLSKYKKIKNGMMQTLLTGEIRLV